MAKIVLNDVTNASTTGIAQINTNNDSIETAFDNTLSRNGASPNHMNADLDMNNNDILNVGALDVTDLTVDGADITGIIDDANAILAEVEAASVIALAAAQEAEDWATVAGGVAVPDGSISRAKLSSAVVDELESLTGPAYGLAASVGSNALTISLKNFAGNDPTATVPVNFTFRDATITGGNPTTVVVSAANSLVISSGSTMGFTSATAGRLWIVAFNDAGTIRLGAINCRSANNIYPLARNGIASSTAEGGAGAADSAHVFYTGTAVTSKAFKILGWLEWSSGLTTAGTWNAVPTTIKLYDIGDKLPGDVIQSASQTTQTNTIVASATFGDTTSTLDMTPTSAANLVAVFATGSLGILSASADKRSQAKIDRGGTQIGLGAQNYKGEAGTQIVTVTMAGMDFPGSTSVQTWKVQINCTDASQSAFWGHSGDGSVTGAFLCVSEVMS